MPQKSKQTAPQVIVAGHICLDILPDMIRFTGDVNCLLRPGQLVSFQDSMTSTGGPVSNTGLVLHRLGIPVRLMGKVGTDAFGDAVMNIISDHDPALKEGMLRDGATATSYTVILSSPRFDRMFLHVTGSNATFTADDVTLEKPEQPTLKTETNPFFLKQRLQTTNPLQRNIKENKQ